MSIPRVDLRQICPDTLALRKWLDYELPEEDAAKIEEHVGVCPSCQRNVDQLGGNLPDPLSPLLGGRDQVKDEEPPCLDGYELIGRIDAGGMGVVWRVRELQMQRDLAIKVMNARASDDAKLVHRFLREVQITGQLAHPFIVPVHTLGRLPDRRLYYTMKLVEGKTLKELLRGRPDPASPQMDYVKIFAQICEAVAFAHRRGILHRDLKPANIMVGEHGEVQVMDWGMAKKLVGTAPLEAEPDHASETVDEAPDDHTRGWDMLKTLCGDRLGTLPYMSPEAACGVVAEVDEQSDVFGLGAILCEILTGEPPYTGQDKASFLQEAREARLDGALDRLCKCGEEPELIQLAERCLAPQKSERPQNANEVTMAVVDHQKAVQERWLQERMERERQRVKEAEVRKKQRVLTIAGGVLVAVLAAGIVGTTIGLVQARDARQGAEKAEADTLAAYREGTNDEIELLIGTKPTLGPQERIYLEKTLKRWQTFADRQGTDERSRAIRAEGTFWVGKLWHNLRKWDEARQEYVKARDLYRQLVDAFPTVPKYKQGLAWTHNNLANLLADLGKPDEALKEYQKTRDLHRQLVAAFPAEPGYQCDLADTHGNLALLQAKIGNPDDANQDFKKALDLLPKLVAAFPTEPEYRQKLADTHNKLGNLLSVRLGKPDEAIKEYEKARDLRLELVSNFPDVPDYQYDLAGTHGNLANLNADLGKPDEALKEYQKALDLQRFLVDAFPGVSVYQQELAITYSGLGRLLADRGKLEEALREFEKACDHQSKLVDVFPLVPAYQDDLAATHYGQGKLLAGLKRWDEAQKEYEKALVLSRKLVDVAPAVPSYQLTLGASYGGVGFVLLKKNRPADSLEWLGKAIQTLTPVSQKEPSYTAAKSFLRKSHLARADAYEQLKERVNAEKDWDQALQLTPTQERLAVRASRADFRLRAGMVAEAVAEVAELTTPGAQSTWTASQWYDFACIYALASSKVASRQREYQDRAMELLHKAVNAGWNDAAHMAKDSDLDPLRGLEDFKKLLDSLHEPKPG